jgi:hypothetical protein
VDGQAKLHSLANYADTVKKQQELGVQLKDQEMHARRLASDLAGVSADLLGVKESCGGVKSDLEEYKLSSNLVECVQFIQDLKNVWQPEVNNHLQILDGHSQRLSSDLARVDEIHFATKEAITYVEYLKQVLQPDMAVQLEESSSQLAGLLKWKEGFNGINAVEIKSDLNVTTDTSAQVCVACV